MLLGRCDWMVIAPLIIPSFLLFFAPQVNFGESGTNSQHSFFQLLHMGQPVPCDFIGFVKPQNNLVHTEGEALASHDELMANFFAQVMDPPRLHELCARGEGRGGRRGGGVQRLHKGCTRVTTRRSNIGARAATARLTSLDLT